MSGLYGSDINNPNFVLRFAIISFMGIAAFASVMFWKSQLLFAAEYQEMPVTQAQLKVKKQNDTIRKKLAGKLTQNQIEIDQ